MGMNVIAVSSSNDKELESKNLGATEFIYYKDNGEMKKWQKMSSRIIINTTYETNITELLYGLQPGGLFIQIGMGDEKHAMIFNHLDLVVN